MATKTDRINAILIAEDYEKLKEVGKKHGITPLMLIKLLVDNFDERLDKIEQLDAKGKHEFSRVCLVLGTDTVTRLNEIAAAHDVSATTVLRSLIRAFVAHDRAPREYVVFRFSGDPTIEE